MKRGIVLVCLLLSIFAFGGCALVNVKAPFDTDLDQTRLGSKVGVADAYSVLWLVSWGDASYAAAARNGNIEVLRHADQELLQVLVGAFTRWRVVVYGD